MVEVGFEPTKLTQQILSLPPLTTRELNLVVLLELYPPPIPLTGLEPVLQM